MCPQLNGILVLDKPAGITSAKAVAEVKKITAIAKMGHTGTLDPFATGVLICCLNQATRLARFLVAGDKSYEAVLHLGIETDTQDATGRVVAEGQVPPGTEHALQGVFDRFRGKQLQQPPVFAALKHQGVPLYRLARQGKPVIKPPRPVTISDLRIIRVTLPTVRFAVTCSAGTYVRTLSADIGQALGCGGHLARLRRTVSGGFGIAEAVSLETLRELAAAGKWQQRAVPMAEALKSMPLIEADGALLEWIAQGRPLDSRHLPVGKLKGAPSQSPHGPIKVVDGQMRLKAVIQHAGGEAYNYCCVFN